MGTRAVYTFKDEYNTHHVFKHWDGYPVGAIHFLQNAKKHAWKLPRFEADEFAASFISTNKKPGGGDFRLAEHWDRYFDLAYRYEITMKEDKLFISIFERDYKHASATYKKTGSYGYPKYKKVDSGFIDDLAKKYPCDWDNDCE